MNTQEELQEKLSKLEKELWYLVKHTLPNLKDEILGGGNKAQIQELENKINACQDKVETLESEITSIKSRLGTVEDNSTTLSQNLGTLSSKVDTNQNNISVLSGKVESNEGNITSLTGRVSTNESNISTLSGKVNKNIEDISSLNSKVDGFEESIQANASEITLIKGNVTNLSTSVSSINQTMSLYQTKFTNMTNDIHDNASQIQLQSLDLLEQAEDIANNASSIQNLATRLSLVESRPSSSGGGRTIEVIYDMNSTDETINMGFTTGIPAGNNVYWTDTEYDYIRIFATLNNLYAFIELPTANRPKNDFVMQSLATNGKTVHYLKGILYYTQKRVAISRGFTYTFDTTTNALTFATDNPKYLVTRIEGVKGI